MSVKYNPQDSQSKGVLRRLRPPSAKDLRLLHPFSVQPANIGHTYQIESGEDVIAAGSGTIKSIKLLFASWQHSAGLLDDGLTWAVTIDHGFGIETLLHGIQNIEDGIRAGDAVVRGASLGTALTNEIFLQYSANGAFYDPTSINRHFPTLDGSEVPDKGGYIQKAPDLTDRTFLGTLRTGIVNGIRKFFTTDCSVSQMLVNVDFNGDGLMAGQAVAGIADTDYWNIIEAAAFNGGESSDNYACYYGGSAGLTFQSPPVVVLNDYTSARSQVQLHKTAMTLDASSSAEFSRMLSTYVGGYSGSTALVNSFEIRNLTPGAYTLYLYANQGSDPSVTTFQVSVDGGSPTSKTNDPTTVASYIENRNYVIYDLTVVNGSYVTVVANGYLCGMQLFRAAQ